jgi:hypothetical protein
MQNRGQDEEGRTIELEAQISGERGEHLLWQVHAALQIPEAGVRAQRIEGRR